MPTHPRSEPDPLPSASPAGPLPGPPEPAAPASDFTELAARFSVESGGGLSPELSADLALEIVLNEIVEQACRATGATGAAIVLRREEEMICRATSGSTAPALGSRLDTSSGLSGECVKTLHTERCGDVLTDARADAAASERLGVRSVMVMPLLRGQQLVGVFELFSSQPFAFGDGDERVLEELAGRVLANLERALQPLPAGEAAAAEIPPPSADAGSTAGGATEVAAREPDFITLALAAAVLVCAVLLGVLVGRHLGVHRPAMRTHPGGPAPAAGATAASPSASSSGKAESSAESARPAAPAKSGGNAVVPPGGLAVFERGKEIFRMPPAPAEPATAAADRELGVERAASLEREKNPPAPAVQLPPAAAESDLLYRVEPEYPEEARQQRIQGAVVLEVLIGADGAVKDVQTLSGPPQLAQAATDAVRQWRFKPRIDQARAQDIQTRITLNFRLPQ
jgi:TonB family protein